MALHFFLAEHLDGHVCQIADDGFHVPSYVAHFGKLGGLHFQEWCIRKLGKATGDLGFADTGRADHQNVLGGDLVTQADIQLHPAPAVAQGDGHRPFGFVLADDVFVQLVDNLTGSHCRHGCSGFSRWLRALRGCDYDWCRCRCPPRYRGLSLRSHGRSCRYFRAGPVPMPGQRGLRSQWQSGPVPAQ